MNEKPLIEIVGLKKSFQQPDGGELKVLDGIDLTVQKNSLTTLIGPQRVRFVSTPKRRKRSNLVMFFRRHDFYLG